MNALYKTDNYRKSIAILIDSRRQNGSSFSLSTLAEQARIEKSYLSKVMNGTRDLSSDQLYSICEIFSLDERESTYLQMLLDYARTSLVKRKKELRDKIQAIRIQERNIRKNLPLEMVPERPSETVQEYYLDPLAIVVHHYVTIPTYGAHPDRIAKKLGLDSQHLERVLKLLLRLGLITRAKTGAGYEAPTIHLHLPSDSYLYGPYHMLIRGLSYQQIQKIPLEKRMTFSITFTADEATRTTIHENYLAFLRQTEKLIAQAPFEEAFQMNFDLFPWGN